MAKSAPKPSVELPPMDRDQMAKWWIMRSHGYRGYIFEMEGWVLGGLAGILGAAAYAVMDPTFDDLIGLLVFVVCFFGAIWARWKYQNTRYELGLQRYNLPKNWRPSDDYKGKDEPDPRQRRRRR